MTDVDPELDDETDETDDDLDDDEVDDANRVAGAIPRRVLEYVARSMVDEPDAVSVEVQERRGSVLLQLNVAPGDMGRVIGRRGRVAQALRTVIRAAGAREGIDASVDIVD